MSVKTKIKTIGWSALGLCCGLLLVAAMRSKGSEICREINIHLSGPTEHMFVKRSDIENVLAANNVRAGESLDEIDTRAVEEKLENNPWVKDAELFFDNKQVLQVNISEREPIAR